jgi:protein OS-9
LDAEPDDGKISTEVARLETKGSTRYMVQRLSGGTECDLTGKERKIEVQVSTSMLFMI